ncbi:MAG TPA: hypothetical protein VIY47_06880, partial [Ignavibacteriaceae bacterium]
MKNSEMISQCYKISGKSPLMVSLISKILNHKKYSRLTPMARPSLTNHGLVSLSGMVWIFGFIGCAILYFAGNVPTWILAAYFVVITLFPVGILSYPWVVVEIE